MITKEEAQKALGPYHSDLADSIHEAFAAWRAQAAPGLPFYKKRTQANFVQDAAETVLRSKFGSLPGVILSNPKKDRFWILFQGSNLLVRIKKLNERYGTTNYPTTAARMFDHQAPIPGIPGQHRLTLGYRLNAIGTEVQSVWIALLIGSMEPTWKYELCTDNGVTSIVPDREPQFPAVAAELKLKPSAKRKPKSGSR